MVIMLQIVPMITMLPIIVHVHAGVSHRQMLAAKLCPVGKVGEQNVHKHLGSLLMLQIVELEKCSFHQN